MRKIRKILPTIILSAGLFLATQYMANYIFRTQYSGSRMDSKKSFSVATLAVVRFRVESVDAKRHVFDEIKNYTVQYGFVGNITRIHPEMELISIVYKGTTVNFSGSNIDIETFNMEEFSGAASSGLPLHAKMDVSKFFIEFSAKDGGVGNAVVDEAQRLATEFKRRLSHLADVKLE